MMSSEGSKTVTLYDAGGLIIGVVLLGVPFGTLFDYFWNFVILSVALPRVGGAGYRAGCGARGLYCLFATVLGIDLAYFELTWDTDFGKSAVWSPAMPFAAQLALIAIPVVMLGLVNFALSYSYLRLDRKPAMKLGAAMGILTAPWVVPIVPYLAGWVK
jgi:hypothetical protein